MYRKALHSVHFRSCSKWSISGKLRNLVKWMFRHDVFYAAMLFFYQEDATGQYNRFNHPRLLVKLEGLSLRSSCFAVYGPCMSNNMEA